MTEIHPPPRAYPPGFMVLHGNRLEDLRELLIAFVRAQALPPLLPEVILLQSNGMKHWLELGLASDDGLGICAATRLELPSGYLWQLYRLVLGADAVPPHMPFDKDHLLWRLLRLLPQLAASQPVYAPLARYLGGTPDARKLYQLALQIADVFDAYQSYRADWLDDWAAGSLGHDLLRQADGQTSALDESHAWQAQLWRDLRADVGPALADASRASVHARFMAALKAAPALATLPPRIVVFGVSSLPLQTVQALAELGRFCQVLLLVQNPCQHYWGDIVEAHAPLRAQVRRRQAAKPSRSASPPHDTLHTDSHPLLASWGKQGRDYLHLLDGFDQVERYQHRLSRVEVFVDPLQGGASRLHALQSGIFNLQPLTDVPVVLQKDESIQLVTCHSAQREVEVLHNQLLAWFDADAQLNPPDVMVMVPDMEAFAPHIQAVFGRFAPGDDRHIPYSVTDATPRQSPLLQALAQLLSLPTSRLSLADWLALFEVAALRQRFGVTEADVLQLQDWLTQAGVRWGLDAQHRMTWGVPGGVTGLEQNTWAFGLRRLLLGYAVGAGTPWGGTLPQAALSGLDARLASALLDWVAAITQTLQELSTQHTPEQWSLLLGALLERFFLPADEAQERQLLRCQAALQAWQQACAQAQLECPLALDVVREHWLAQLEEPSLQQRFFGGGVQFGTLMPMRAIPFKAICLLGMNDGDYPRQKTARDFDLMAQCWRAGDRSRREDDRYLFLEAILSARHKLYISWQGHRASDNAEQPPSVLVAQLIDHLQAAWSPRIEPEQQPLQAFSSAYFLQDSPHRSYDRDWARVHAPAATPSPEHSTEAACAPQSLTQADLRQLLRQPVEVFFKARLRVRLDTPAELEQQEEPFALNQLEQYQVGQELLAATDPAAVAQALALGGKLPIAAFGQRDCAQLQEKAQVVRERQADWLQRYPQRWPAQSVALTLGGVSLSANLSEVYGGAGGCLQFSARTGAVLEGKKKDDQRPRGHIVAGLWADHLLACASALPMTSVQFGLDGQVVLNPLEQQVAIDILQRLLSAYQAAWQRPLPVACKTGWAYVQAAASSDPPGQDPHELAEKVFDGDDYRTGERDESAYLTRAFDSYAELEAELPHWADMLYGDLARHAQLG